MKPEDIEVIVNAIKNDSNNLAETIYNYMFGLRNRHLTIPVKLLLVSCLFHGTAEVREFVRDVIVEADLPGDEMDALIIIMSVSPYDDNKAWASLD